MCKQIFTHRSPHYAKPYESHFHNINTPKNPDLIPFPTHEAHNLLHHSLYTGQTLPSFQPHPTTLPYRLPALRCHQQNGRSSGLTLHPSPLSETQDAVDGNPCFSVHPSSAGILQNTSSFPLLIS